jgi:hypothetical protein
MKKTLIAISLKAIMFGAVMRESVAMVELKYGKILSDPNHLH